MIIQIQNNFPPTIPPKWQCKKTTTKKRKNPAKLDASQKYGHPGHWYYFQWSVDER